MNREQWLTEIANRCKVLFRGFKLGDFRLTCGWPCKNARARRSLRVGECHYPEVSKGGLHEIFISPLIADSLEVAGTVLHEMAHIAAGWQAKHGPGFIRVCRHVGLTAGRPTCVMPGPALNKKIEKIIEQVGPYPHQAMLLVPQAGKEKKSVSLECTDCGCVVRMSLNWLDMSGYPTCGCGGHMYEKLAGGKD